jgi:hypothetical protein
MADEEKKTCAQCRWALGDDYGYSNYTTEGAYFHCMKKLHPEDGFDMWYGEEKRLEFAATCSGFEAGEITNLDCDREDQKPDGDLSSYAHYPDVALAVNAWNKNQQ